MEAVCRIELFGGLRAILGQGVVVRLPTRKAALLLAYLALALGKPQLREHLIDWLWPELELDAGRNNLSTLLSLLRRTLEVGDTPSGSILQADRHSITLNAATVQTDVSEFDNLMRQAARTADVETRCRYWHQAACLVQGELLPDCYEEWACRARTLYAERYGEILRNRAALLFDLSRFEEAQADAAQALQANPRDEAACQLRMRSLAALGRSDAALQAYVSLERALQTQLETTPDASTRALQARLRSEPERFVVSPPEVRGTDCAAITPGSKSAIPVAAPVAPAAGSFPSISALPACAAQEAAALISHLPTSLTRFFGREREREELQSLLRRPDTRLITLLGAGGAGKTRLALETGRQAAPEYNGRVWFIALADIPDPALIPMRMLTALQLPLSHADPLLSVIAALAAAPALLILDNMEHLLSGAADAQGATSAAKAENAQDAGAQALVRRLLESIPHLTCLATSRQSLYLEGEQEYALPPLALPTEEEKEKSRKAEKEKIRDTRYEIEETQSKIQHLKSKRDSSLLSCASVALYVDRAQRAKADFVLTAHNAEAVAALCRKLEGMPLAIEMAAAWIKTVPPARMLARLEHQLEWLVSRRRDLPARQQSLRATCEWSYSLLSPELKQAFRRLSLFRGGWTAEAAEAVWEGEKEKRRKGEKKTEEKKTEDSELSTINYQLSTSLHVLAELQERSLILLVETEGEEAEEDEPRYRMLEPLREFGREKLAETGELEGVERLHARYFRELAAMATPHYQGAEESMYMARLRQEQDNLRVALAWHRERDGWNGLRLAADLSRYWELSGLLAEGRQWLGDMLALPSAQERTEERALALHGAGALSLLRADYADAEALYAEAYAIFKALNNLRGQANALNGRGAIVLYEQEYERAREFYEQSLAISLEAGEEAGIAASCHSLGNVEMRLENYDCARAYMERAAQLRRKYNDEHGLAQTLGALGQLAYHQGRYQAALALFGEILQTFHRMGIVCSVALCLRDIAEVLWHQGERRQVVCLIGASQALRERTGFAMPPAEQETHARELAELREELGEREFEQWWAQGTAMSAEQALTYAVQFTIISQH